MTYIPLVFIRVALEETMMIKNIGKDYLSYKSEVNAFLPSFKKNRK
jgi:protein-S-isoprenylcysteine O-methyltransferase Ste14